MVDRLNWGGAVGMKVRLWKYQRYNFFDIWLVFRESSQRAGTRMVAWRAHIDLRDAYNFTIFSTPRIWSLWITQMLQWTCFNALLESRMICLRPKLVAPLPLGRIRTELESGRTMTPRLWMSCKLIFPSFDVIYISSYTDFFHSQSHDTQWNYTGHHSLGYCRCLHSLPLREILGPTSCQGPS